MKIYFRLLGGYLQFMRVDLFMDILANDNTLEIDNYLVLD